MAFVVVPVLTGQSARSWQVDASADADAFVDIPHGYGVIPRLVTCNPIAGTDAQALANSNCGWSVDPAGTTALNVRARKSVQAGSATGACLIAIQIPVV